MGGSSYAISVSSRSVVARHAARVTREQTTGLMSPKRMLLSSSRARKWKSAFAKMRESTSRSVRSPEERPLLRPTQVPRQLQTPSRSRPPQNRRVHQSPQSQNLRHPRRQVQCHPLRHPWNPNWLARRVVQRKLLAQQSASWVLISDKTPQHSVGSYPWLICDLANWPNTNPRLAIPIMMKESKTPCRRTAGHSISSANTRRGQ